MHPNARQHFIGLVDEIVANLSDDPAPDPDELFKIHFGQEGGFLLTTDTAEPYRDCMALLLSTKDWEEKFSEKYIGKMLNRIISARIHRSSSEFDEFLDEQLESLQSFSTEQVVYVPLEGVQLDADEFEIGSVKLISLEQHTLAGILNVDSNLLESDTSQDFGEEPDGETLRARFGGQLLGKVAAQYSVVAEPIRAKERALEETRRVLDIFRMSIPFLYPRGHRVKVAIQGEYLSTNRVLPTRSEDGNVRLAGERTGALRPFEIDSDTIEQLDELGIFSLAKILTRESTSEFEEVVLRGVHWFAVAQTQSEPESEFLSLITAIETYLTPRDGSPIGHAIAEGTALILGETLENRLAIKKRMKTLYGKRSAVSHGGSKSISDTDLAYARHYSLALTQFLVSRLENYASHEELLNWLESERLS